MAKAPAGKKLANLGPALFAELKKVADEASFSDDAIVRACLKAGLSLIRRDNYALLKTDDQYLNDLREALQVEQLAVPFNPALPSSLAKSTNIGLTKIADLRDLVRQTSDKARNLIPFRPGEDIPYYEMAAAGLPHGTYANDLPGTVPIPAGWKLPIDFVVRVNGNSMTGYIEHDELGAFKKDIEPTNGHVVAALVEGQMVVKLFSEEKGRPVLISTNDDVAAIPVTNETRVQGVFVSKFPLPGGFDSKRPLY